MDELYNIAAEAKKEVRVANETHFCVG
jgi:hypothetical protein